MESKLFLSVVIPSFLEESNLRLLLPQIQEVLRATGRPTEILVVDSVAPCDATHELCDGLGVRWVSRAPSNKYGDAVRVGIREAKGEWFLFMDGDGSHPPSFIINMIDELVDSDLVIASRYVKGGGTEVSRLLSRMSWLLNWSYRTLLKFPVYDISNSFRIYKAGMLRTLDLHANNFDIVEEILFKLIHEYPEIRIREIPFCFKNRIFGGTKRALIPFILTFLVTMIRLRFFRLKSQSKPGGLQEGH